MSLRFIRVNRRYRDNYVCVYDIGKFVYNEQHEKNIMQYNYIKYIFKNQQYLKILKVQYRLLQRGQTLNLDLVWFMQYLAKWDTF